MRLQTYFKDCTNLNELKEHMPFDFEDRVTKDKQLKTLCQDGYIIRYSISRRTPLFTAERLDGTVLKSQRVKKVILYQWYAHALM